MNTPIRIQIAAPCHENWDKMTAAEQGKFCLSCQKTVTDYSMMTDQEILEVIARPDTSSCGRFTNNQLNRVLNVNPDSNTHSGVYAWTVAIATLLSVAQASGQSATTPGKNQTEPAHTAGRIKGEIVVEATMPGNLRKVSGKVVDSKTNKPVSFASVLVKGTTSGVTADENGNFSINILFGSQEVTLVISAVGYTTQELAVHKNAGTITLYLEPELKALGEVVITEDILVKAVYTVGTFVTIEEVKTTEKIKRVVEDITPDVLKSEYIRVLPNPIHSGTQFLVELTIKEEASFSLQVLDTEGRLLHRQRVTSTGSKQVVTVSANNAWNKGVYWVRLVSESDQKIFHAKLLIQ